jgi:glycosyltransferase involved in cell wall biosynthesis
MAADNLALREATKLFCNSAVVRYRLHKFNGIDAEVLYPPLRDGEFHYADCGDYLLYLARLTPHKRQWLALESLRRTRNPVRLVIAGRPDPGAEFYLDELRGLVARYTLEDRVTLLANWVPESDKVDLLARCLAVLYFPFDEDSYGYVSLEAHAAAKPVLTTTDAGGTNELIADGINGFVTPPDPDLIAQAMDALYENRTGAATMGRAGSRRVGELGIGWERVVNRLLS